MDNSSLVIVALAVVLVVGLTVHRRFRIILSPLEVGYNENGEVGECKMSNCEVYIGYDRVINESVCATGEIVKKERKQGFADIRMLSIGFFNTERTIILRTVDDAVWAGRNEGYPKLLKGLGLVGLWGGIAGLLFAVDVLLFVMSGHTKEGEVALLIEGSVFVVKFMYLHIALLIMIFVSAYNIIDGGVVVDFLRKLSGGISD